MLQGGSRLILSDLRHVSWVGSVLYRSCTKYHNGRLGSRWSTADRDLSDLSDLSVRSVDGSEPKAKRLLEAGFTRERRPKNYVLKTVKDGTEHNSGMTKLRCFSSIQRLLAEPFLYRRGTWLTKLSIVWCVWSSAQFKCVCWIADDTKSKTKQNKTPKASHCQYLL